MKELRKDEIRFAGDLHKYGFYQADMVYQQSGCTPSLITGSAIGHCIWILEEEDDESRENNR